jgi:hypothetical protein
LWRLLEDERCRYRPVVVLSLHAVFGGVLLILGEFGVRAVFDLKVKLIHSELLRSTSIVGINPVLAVLILVQS